MPSSSSSKGPKGQSSRANDHFLNFMSTDKSPPQVFQTTSHLFGRKIDEKTGHVEDAPHKEHITKTYANHHQPGRKSSH